MGIPRRLRSVAVPPAPAPLAIAPLIPPALAEWNERWAVCHGAEPLRITASLEGRISLSAGPMAIDSLLAAMIALRLALPPLLLTSEPLPIEIPVQRAADPRFHLASFSVGAFERFGVRWVNRRFPIAEAQTLGSAKIRTISIKAGPCKSYRIPLPAGHLASDQLTWYMVGAREPIASLLSLCSYLGKRRAVGLGRVVRWTVEPCEPWGPGFPLLSPEGEPLRPLPPQWPGVRSGAERGYRTLSYPYTDRTREELAYMAGGMPG